MKFYRSASPEEVARFVYHSGETRDLPPDHARLLKAHGLGEFTIETRHHAHFPERQVFDLAHDNALIAALRAIVHAPLPWIVELRPPGKAAKQRRQDQRAALDALLHTISRARRHRGTPRPPAVWEQLFLHEFARTHPDDVVGFGECATTLCGMGIVHLTPQLREGEGECFTVFLNFIHQWLQDNPPAPAIVEQRT